MLQKSLPSSAYLSQEIFAREKENIFFHEWICAGREEDIPQPGDHRVLDILGESVLVVRTREGKLKAHYNVCRHRGARLCLAPGESEEVKLNGSVGLSGIRCPYHLWTYSLDGTLLGAPHLREGEGFCKEDFSLYPVGLETWGGFYFLNLTPEKAAAEGRTLHQQLGPIPERVKRYPLSELRSARRITYDVAANWKVIAENYNECYHCGGVHPELCEVVPAFRENGGANLDWERGVSHREGAFTFTWTGTTNRAPFATLNEDEKIRHKGELIYPNFMLSLAAEHATAFFLQPIGPGRTQIVCEFLFHPQEIRKPDFDPRDTVDFWDLTNRQDWAICERVQTGMQSRAHHAGYYAPMEDYSLDIRRYWKEKMKESG
ncbi:MAG: aromatic ring-hydroxylating dioxygenase subunit alpha [Acidobacteria bacterium]|nr:aromatic ring-hydroxylating dioxygenase subunit alpha [Acidobacteriota bacterium]